MAEPLMNGGSVVGRDQRDGPGAPRLSACAAHRLAGRMGME